MEIAFGTDRPTFSIMDIFFNEEDGELYAYLVNGRYFYKYDLTAPEAPEVVRKTKDNSWYWYNGVKKKGDKVITLGNKGVRVYTEEGVVTDSYDIVNNVAENVSFSQGNNFLFHMNDDHLEVFDTASRENISRIKYINVSEDPHGREIYNDSQESLIYLVGDGLVRAVDFQGNTVKSFDHTGSQGFDIIPSSDSDHVYFSDGVGVVKANKNDLSPQSWKFTTDLARSNGWAMDIETVDTGNEEKLVVFNNSSILVMNKDLELIASAAAERTDYSPVEPPHLNLDKNRAAPDSTISLSGGGFGLYEDLEIYFADEKFEAEADGNGSFSKMIEVPTVLPMKTDITVVGERTDRNYSISFKIE